MYVNNVQKDEDIVDSYVLVSLASSLWSTRRLSQKSTQGFFRFCMSKMYVES